MWCQKQAQVIIKDKKGEANKEEYEMQKEGGGPAKEEETVSQLTVNDETTFKHSF